MTDRLFIPESPTGGNGEGFLYPARGSARCASVAFALARSLAGLAPVGFHFGVAAVDGHFGTPSAPYATETQFHFTVPVGEYQSIISDRSGRIRSKHLLKL